MYLGDRLVLTDGGPLDTAPQYLCCVFSQRGYHLEDAARSIRRSCHMSEDFDLDSRLQGLGCMVKASTVLHNPADGLIADIRILETKATKLAAGMLQTTDQALVVCFDVVPTEACRGELVKLSVDYLFFQD